MADGPEKSANFGLSQNYPNPFHEKTSITFHMQGDGFVSLKVYNILGEEVAELAGTWYPAGMHTVQFYGSGILKGIYYYTIKTQLYTATRKMISHL